MKIQKITYGKSVQLTNDLWEKIGVEIELDEGQDIEKARILAKEAIEHIFKSNNPSVPVEVLQAPQLPVINSGTSETSVDHIFEATKLAIEKAESKEEAEEILIASGFRYNIELKNIVNSKPPKQ